MFQKKYPFIFFKNNLHPLLACSKNLLKKRKNCTSGETEPEPAKESNKTNKSRRPKENGNSGSLTGL